MNSVLIICLLAAAAMPLISAMLVVMAMILGWRMMALVMTWIGIGGMTVFSGVLLAITADAESDSIELSLWTWLSLSTPISPSVAFGLDATAMKSGIICGMGAAMLLMLGMATRRATAALSLEAIAAMNWLCVGMVAFIDAPNLPQALLGWAVGSLSAAILIRRSNPGRKDVGAVIPNLQFSLALSACEETARERLWSPVVHDFPNWIAEQIEFLEAAPKSIQLLAGALGTFAILLTWLTGG